MQNGENIIFWNNLEKIKNLLQFDDVDFSKSMGIHFEEYDNLKASSKTLPVDCLFELAEKMNFHLEDLLLKDDFSLNYNPHAQVPLLERYRPAPHSQTRAIINILDYLERVRGTRAKINLIRKFQLSEDYIKNEHNQANVLLISDIVKYLAVKHNFTKADFVGIGRRMPFLTNNKILKEKLADKRNAHEILDCFVYECTKLFDTNCTYKISELNSNYAVINVEPNKNVLEELQIPFEKFGNEELCLTKMGNFSSTMYYKYGKNAQIKKISSIHDGQKTNKYLLNLEPFKKMENIH